MRRTSHILGLMAAVVTMLVMPSVGQAQTTVAATGQTVVTGAEGRQILFRDKTSITAGPDSTISVRRANYDQQTGKANIVINVAKGAFRYITGDVDSTHTVTTPLSTVGVRGTVIEGYVMQNGYELFILVEGAFQVCTQAMCQQVTQAGTYVLVSPNKSITPPLPIPPSMMSALLLTVPSVDLVLENFSTILQAGGDPLVRFRDLNDAKKGNAPLPPPPAPPMECGECDDHHHHHHYYDHYYDHDRDHGHDYHRSE